MDSGVAVRASGKKCPGPLGGDTFARPGIDSVAFMALETQKGFPGVEKFAVHRTVRRVAVETVFGNICMFIKKWASFFSMTLDTGFFDRVPQ